MDPERGGAQRLDLGAATGDVFGQQPDVAADIFEQHVNMTPERLQLIAGGQRADGALNLLPHLDARGQWRTALAMALAMASCISMRVASGATALAMALAMASCISTRVASGATALAMALAMASRISARVARGAIAAHSSSRVASGAIAVASSSRVARGAIATRSSSRVASGAIAVASSPRVASEATAAPMAARVSASRPGTRRRCHRRQPTVKADSRFPVQITAPPAP